MDLISPRACKQAEVSRQACRRRGARRHLPQRIASGLVVFAIPGQEPRSFDAAVGVVRKFASDPTVAAEIAKLKSNELSQNMFPVTTQPNATKYPQILCRTFSTTGSCSYGNRCRFAHTSTPKQCTFCNIKGHTFDVCRKRLAQQRSAAPANTPAANSVSLLSSSESAYNVFHLDPAMVTPTPNSSTTDQKHNVCVFPASPSGPAALLSPKLTVWT